MIKPKMIVIGLDGATWNLIKPFIDDGKLPTISKLMTTGCHGNLESSIPHITFPAWKCYSTGKNPGKLSVYGFIGIDIDERKFVFNNSASFKSDEIWDYMSGLDISCGVIGMPTTYPPKKINGFMVSEFTSTNSGYAFPKNLENELKNLFQYRPNQESSFKVNADNAIDDCKNLIKQRFDAAKYLIKKFEPTFINLTIFQIDDVQHFGWEYMEKSDEKYGKLIENFWIMLDNEISKLMQDYTDESTYILMMSDHGFTKIKYRFNITAWLINKGYLVLNNNLRLLNLLSTIGINKELLMSLSLKVGLLQIIRKHIPIELLQRFNIMSSSDGEIAATTEMSKLINWNKSKLLPVPIGDGLLYINPNILSPNSEEYNKFKNEVIKELENIKHPGTDEKIFAEIYQKEDIYSGEYLKSAPDIILLPEEGVQMPTRFGSDEIWIDKPSTPSFSAIHKLQGIFLAHGPDIKQGANIEGTRIIDLAPTILHMYGVPIPRDMDGRVLAEIFREDSEMAQREIVYEKDKTKAEKNKDALKNKIGKLKTKRKI